MFYVLCSTEDEKEPTREQCKRRRCTPTAVGLAKRAEEAVPTRHTKVNACFSTLSYLVDGKHSLEALVLLAVPLIVGRRQAISVRRQPLRVGVADLEANVQRVGHDEQSLRAFRGDGFGTRLTLYLHGKTLPTKYMHLSTWLPPFPFSPADFGRSSYQTNSSNALSGGI